MREGRSSFGCSRKHTPSRGNSIGCIRLAWHGMLSRHNGLSSLVLTVGLEHAEDLGAGDGADLGDAVGVTQDHTDLQKQQREGGIQKIPFKCGYNRGETSLHTAVGERGEGNLQTAATYFPPLPRDGRMASSLCVQATAWYIGMYQFDTNEEAATTAITPTYSAIAFGNCPNEFWVQSPLCTPSSRCIFITWSSF